MDKLKLCYVERRFAWFTTQALNKQWGDDWDDEPYEHNAGDPYYPNTYAGEAPDAWKLVMIAYTGDLLEYCDQYGKYLSVKDINRGDAPWLATWDDEVKIYAGTTLDDFIKLVQDDRVRGNVYLTEKDWKELSSERSNEPSCQIS